MSSEDFTTRQKAANALWPEAILSNSGIILGLAKLAAKDILKRKPANRLQKKTGGLLVALDRSVLGTNCP